MRKNIIITALALMGAIAFTSCVREEFETPGEAQKDNTVNFTINTGSAEVKSYMEYDEEAGAPDLGIAPGTKFEDLPDDFECPLCLVGKDEFSEV